MKQLRRAMFVLTSLLAAGVLAQGMEPATAGLFDPMAVDSQSASFEELANGATWQTNTPIPQTGGLAQMSTVDAGDGASLLVIGGGITGALIATNIVRKYDTTTDTWSTVAPMPLPDRSYGSAVRLGGCVYVFGGYDGVNALNNLFVYHIEENSWSQGAPLPSGRFGPGVATDGDDTIWVIGGFDLVNPNNQVWKYTPSTNSWSTGFAPMPNPLGRIHGAYVPADGPVHVFAGGFDGQFHYIYNTGTNSWTTGAFMPNGVTDPATVYNPADGKIYLAGGGGFPPRPQGFTQIYDPATNTWSQGPRMPAPAVDNTSGALIGGALYVEGGYNGLDAVSVNYSLAL